MRIQSSADIVLSMIKILFLHFVLDFVYLFAINKHQSV